MDTVVVTTHGTDLVPYDAARTIDSHFVPCIRNDGPKCTDPIRTDENGNHTADGKFLWCAHTDHKLPTHWTPPTYKVRAEALMRKARSAL